MPTTIPTTTSSNRPSSPSVGDAYFETDMKRFIIYEGPTASDWRGFNNDGTLVGFTGNSHALNFDGTDDYLDISGIATDIDNWTDASWSAWYKGTDTSGYIFRASPAGVANPHIGMSIQSNKLFGVVFDGSSQSSNLHQTTINDDSWHHLAVTFNGSTGALKTYVDGTVNNTSVTNQGGDMGTGYTAANVGRRPSSSHLYTAGLIDEFAIWDAELTATEVGNLKTTSGANAVPANISSIGRSGNGPIGWWRMGDNNSGQGSTITDLGKDSGGNDSGNDGTINGAAFEDLSTAPETIYY